MLRVIGVETSPRSSVALDVAQDPAPALSCDQAPWKDTELDVTQGKGAFVDVHESSRDI